MGSRNSKGKLKKKNKIKPVNRQHNRNAVFLFSKAKSFFETLKNGKKSRKSKAITEIAKAQTCSIIDEKHQPKELNDNSSDHSLSDETINNPNIKKETNTLSVSNDNSKGFVGDIKELSDILGAIASIGTAFMLIISTLKVFCYQYYYGIPVFNLVNNLTVFYGVVLNSIILGVVVFLICTHFYMIKHIKAEKSLIEYINIAITPVFCIFTFILIVYVAYYYAFNGGIVTELVGESNEMTVFAIYVIVLIISYLIPLLWYFGLNIKQKKNTVSTEIITSNENECKKQTAKKTKLNISKTIAIISAAIILVEFFLVFVQRLYQNDVFPQNIRDYEIVTIGSQDYATVCNSSDGKLVVLCERYYNDKNERSLVIYKYFYRFIDPKDHIFFHTYFQNVDSVNIRHSPVDTKKGSEAVSVVFSDKTQGNGVYDLKTNTAYYLYVDITNNSNKALRIGDTYKLEVYEYGKWRSMSPSVLLDSDCNIIVGPDETASAFFDFFVYGELEPGHYRIAISADENSSSFYFAEFIINSEGKIEPLNEKATVQQ